MVGGNRGYHPRLPCECRGPHSRHPLSINSKPEDPPTEEYRRWSQHLITTNIPGHATKIIRSMLNRMRIDQQHAFYGSNI
ncbi:unnamed protein product [Lupinus luteus]|uniref:Uncharacterized protein n=1 Tax=Lupinus luteus TaxID=3873 RepID=A0AAV1W785_LUPLU